MTRSQEYRGRYWNDQYSNFIRHEPCPKCHSKDNLGVYSDGHCYCFGCGYIKPPERSLIIVPERIKDNIKERTFADFSPDLPSKSIKWLKSYGITDAEIQANGYVYDEERDYLCWPLDSSEVYQGRYFGSDKDKPRYISHGRLGQTAINVSNETGRTDIIVFVEDKLSAIKVGRLVAAVPICSAKVSIGRLIRAGKLFKHIGIWLDSDKRAQAVKSALIARTVTTSKVFNVFSSKDPKSYSRDQIETLLIGATDQYLNGMDESVSGSSDGRDEEAPEATSGTMGSLEGTSSTREPVILYPANED